MTTTGPLGGRLRGVFPILATCFGPDGAIDYGSQSRLIEFCIEGGVHGLVMLANASEGHLLSGDEKRALLEFGLKAARDRVPVVATVNHPSAVVVGEAARHAEASGAAAVMTLPPFFGRWRAGQDEIRRYLTHLDSQVQIPIVFQDHVLADIPLPVAFLVGMARDFEHLRYLKLESGNIIHKARMLLASSEGVLDGVVGGKSGIVLPEEMEAGCCGTMPSSAPLEDRVPESDNERFGRSRALPVSGGLGRPKPHRRPYYRG